MRRFWGLTLLLALSAGVSAGPITLGARHKDESNGFQIQPPRKWEQVPTKFQEVATVGKWAAKRAKRGWYAASLLVMRFMKIKPAEEGATPQDVLKRGIPGYGSMLRYQPKSVWEYVKRMGNLEVIEDEPEFKMSSKKFRAHMRVYREKMRSTGRDAEKQQTLIVAAEINTVVESEASYGVIYFCTVADTKDMLRPFKTSIKRFKILDDDDDEEAEEGATGDAGIFVDSESKPEIWREARKKKLKSLKDWKAIDTENYLIVYNKAVKKNLLKKVAKHIEAIRAQVYEKLFPPAREIKAVSVVRVCKDRAEYHRYGGPGGSAGYWSRGDEELVIPGDMAKDSLRVLYHEAFHQYIHYAVGDVAPHSWFNEGHGDYFAGHNYSAKKFKAAPFRWRTGTIATALGSKTYVPLKDFLRYTQGQYYANAGLCYAQGWSFVYFLREVERRKIKKYKKYWGLLDRYFAAIKRNVQAVKDKGLEGLNPEPKEEPEPEPEPEPEAEEPAAPTLKRLPGLEGPFPGENPLAGAPPDPEKRRTGETKSVAGPKLNSMATAKDAAVDDMMRGIDIDQLEKDWIEFSK